MITEDRKKWFEIFKICSKKYDANHPRIPEDTNASGGQNIMLLEAERCLKKKVLSSHHSLHLNNSYSLFPIWEWSMSWKVKAEPVAYPSCSIICQITVKDLSPYWQAISFMNTSRKHKTPTWETKVFVTHSHYQWPLCQHFLASVTQALISTGWYKES